MQGICKYSFLIFLSLSLFISCEEDEPEKEDLPKSPENNSINELDQVSKEQEEKDLSKSDNNDK